VKSILKSVKLTSVLENPSDNDVEFGVKSCPICHGVGQIHPRINGFVDYSQVVICKCAKDKVLDVRRKSLIKYCQLPKGAEKMSFENYKTYGDKTLKEAFNSAKLMAAGDEKVKWLTLLGDTDLGKTHLAVAVCKAWLGKGLSAKYVLAPQMLTELRDGFKLKGEDSYRESLSRLQNVDLLVLDDLGTEKVTEWAVEQLQMIIDARCVKQLALIVTSNRPLSKLFYSASKEDSDWVELAGERIASRLQRESWCRVIAMQGLEHRLREIK